MTEYKGTKSETREQIKSKHSSGLKTTTLPLARKSNSKGFKGGRYCRGRERVSHSSATLKIEGNGACRYRVGRSRIIAHASVWPVHGHQLLRPRNRKVTSRLLVFALPIARFEYPTVRAFPKRTLPSATDDAFNATRLLRLAGRFGLLCSIRLCENRIGNRRRRSQLVASKPRGPF